MQIVKAGGALALLALWCSPLAAKEHLIELGRTEAADFTREVSILGGKFKELCVPLKSGDRIEWRFSSSADTAFNIHFHVGADVSYPERRERARAAEGVLAAEKDETYCWMWKSLSGEALVSVSLKART